jgi:uridylate kinase
MDKKLPIIISLGGSLVVPNGGIDHKFLADFNKFIREKIADGWRFFIVVGGGSTARHYIDAAKNTVGTITDWDLDFLGIHSTRLNAHLIRTIFHDLAHPRIVENYRRKIVNLKEKIVVAAGWEPGHSTDYDAVYLARDYQGKVIINMSNTNGIYDSDPKKNKDAKMLKKVSWSEMENLVGGEWKPGANFPFDPLATKFAKKLALTVYAVGNELSNLDNILNGNDFEGTIIQ